MPGGRLGRTRGLHASLPEQDSSAATFFLRRLEYSPVDHLDRLRSGLDDPVHGRAVASHPLARAACDPSPEDRETPLRVVHSPGRYARTALRRRHRVVRRSPRRGGGLAPRDRIGSLLNPRGAAASFPSRIRCACGASGRPRPRARPPVRHLPLRRDREGGTLARRRTA